MAVSRAKKHEKVAQLASELKDSTSAIIGSFTGLTAAKDYALRQTVRQAGGSYRVIKNKLAPKAGEGTQIESALIGLKGVTSVAYTSGDPVALAKALSGWVKENTEFFTFKLGIVEGKVITVQEIQNLATLPGKEELFSKLLFLMQSPAQRLATVINATGRDLAVVINQAVEKGKFGAPEAPAAAAPAEAGAAPATEAAPEAEAPVVEAAPPIEEKSEATTPADTEGGSAQAEAASTEPPVEG